ncbi:hypothetical protein GOODEAATRI_025269, partial [Goodea atripinnis]
FKFLMLVTLACAAMTIIFFIISQVNEGHWHWGDHTVQMNSAFFTGIYGMWNLYVFAIMFLYAPSHKRYGDEQFFGLGEIALYRISKSDANFSLACTVFRVEQVVYPRCVHRPVLTLRRERRNGERSPPSFFADTAREPVRLDCTLFRPEQLHCYRSEHHQLFGSTMDDGFHQHGLWDVWRMRWEATYREEAEMFTCGPSAALFMPPLAIRKTEYRPTIDKTNSLVSHSAPSKPPLDAHQPEWAARGPG